LAADKKSFETVIGDNNHVLHKVLPPQSQASGHCNLRQCKHNFSLPERTIRLIDNSFIQRMLYHDVD